MNVQACVQDRCQHELVGRRPNHLLLLTPESVGLREPSTGDLRQRDVVWIENSCRTSAEGDANRGEAVLEQGSGMPTCPAMQWGLPS